MVLKKPVYLLLSLIFLTQIFSCAKKEEKKAKLKIVQLKDVDLTREPEGKKLYLHYCSFCHGIKGEGDGFNAWNLKPKPTDFTNIPFMKGRTDKWLALIITKGGEINGLSPSMSPWGKTLTSSQITVLIKYIRSFSEKGEA